MKLAKKFLALFLALTLVLSLTACSSSSDDSAADDTTEAEEESTVADTEEEAEGDTLTDEDVIGNTYTYSCDYIVYADGTFAPADGCGVIFHTSS